MSKTSSSDCALSNALALGALLAFGVLTSAVAQDHGGVRENAARVEEWNRFAARLEQLERVLRSERSVRTVTVDGGYGDSVGGPRYYREQSRYDASSGHLISRIRRERIRPSRVHVIEVFIRDETGHVVRDYAAAFLPRYRNAPFQTLINFHDRNEGLSAFRQFDASGERIYEHCAGHYFGEAVELSFDYAELPDSATQLADPQYGEIYSACFGFLPARAGSYLDPLEEPIFVRATSRGPGQRDMTTPDGSTTHAPPNSAEDYVVQARALFEALEFEAAISALDNAIELDGTADAAWFWRGMARGRARDFTGAIADLSVFLQRNPASTLGFTKRGIRHFWNGERVKAERDFRRALEIDPDNAEAHDDLGVILAQDGKLEAARHHFIASASREPTYQKAHHNLALTEFLSGNPAEALTAIQRALRLDDRDGASLRLRARILRALGRETEAAQDEIRAAELPELNWSERAALH